MSECLILSSLVVSLSVKLHCNDALHMQHTGMHSFSGTHIRTHAYKYIQCICTYVCRFLACIFCATSNLYISHGHNETHVYMQYLQISITGANTYIRTYIHTYCTC